jgi:hypothetical protein
MAENLGVVLEWNETEAARWVHDPHGELGRVLMHAIGVVVLARAQVLVLRRTGRMAAAMTFNVAADEIGVFCDIVSPVTSAAGFPYAIMHEGRKVRDRRPHRSLVPAAESLRTRPL